jgi:hypothetical protein
MTSVPGGKCSMQQVPYGASLLRASRVTTIQVSRVTTNQVSRVATNLDCHLTKLRTHCLHAFKVIVT